MSVAPPSSCYGNTTSPPHLGQQDIDNQIQKLERGIVELKRRRNELCPISCVPGEVLCEILFAATSSLTTHGDQVEQPRDMGYIQTMCHVCHSWRSLALGCPSLWREIDVQPGASAQRLNFLLDNAHPLPLHLHLQESLPQQVVVESAPGPLTTFKQVLSERSPIGFHQVLLRGRSHFLKDCLTITPKKDALSTVRILLTGPATRADANMDVREGLLDGEAPSLRTLELLGCTMPLTSRVIYSPNLTRLVLDTPRGTAREVLEMLQQIRQLEDFRMACPRNPPSSEPPHLLCEVLMPRIAHLSLIGHSTLVLRIIEKLRLPGKKVGIVLYCSLPVESNPSQTAEKLFKAVRSARVPPVKHGEENNQPFSPKKICFHCIPESKVPVSISSCPLHLNHEEDLVPGNHGPHSMVNVQLFRRRTGAPIDLREWHPMFTARSPESLLQTTTWSLASLVSVRVANTRGTCPPLDFWKFMSMIATLHRIIVEARYVPNLIPSLFTAWDAALEVHAAFPFPRLRHIKITGTVSPDTGPESLLESIANAFQRRCDLASLCDGRIEGAQSLDLLELTDCLSPPSEFVLLALPPTHVKEVSWKLKSAPGQSQ